MHLSIRIKRQGAVTGMWSPEPIEKVPCLVERKEFELVMNFTPSPGALRMSDLRGSEKSGLLEVSFFCHQIR